MDSLTNEQVVELLGSEEYGQSHLFSAEQSPEQKDSLIQQLRHFDKNYPGGIKDYIARARKLLEESSAGVNPFEGWSPSIPEGETINPELNLDQFNSFEETGMQEVGQCAFVLVAGGLGERLGYNGIKVGLPVELLTQTTFLELYVQNIIALQERTGQQLPLAIMTSEDTHEKTLQLLEENGYFGLNKDQVTLMKQEKVPALIDNNARFAVEEGEILGKPHGHGDVHILLYQYGLPQKWIAEGKKWMVFIQDTNSLVFKALPSFLGVSIQNEFSMNYMTVPRKPKEALGGIVKLTKEDNVQTVNVEYNIIESLMKTSGMHSEGDVTNKALGLGSPQTAEFSPFPGNTNTLLFKLDDYVEALNQTGGHMPEFVNPKYADSTKTKFKSPTRLECMMQDFGKMFPRSKKVGFTQYERWLCFSAVKNNIEEAAAKSSQGMHPWSAGSGECDYYFCNNMLLRLAGAQIEEPQEDIIFAGIRYRFPAKVVIMPSFACCFKELKDKVKGEWSISANSALILEGRTTEINGLKLDGHLVIGESRENVVKEDGQVPSIVPTTESDPEYLQIRGFKFT